MSLIDRYNQVLSYDRKSKFPLLRHRWFLVTLKGVDHDVFSEMYKAYPCFVLWLVNGVTYSHEGQRAPYLMLL